MSAWSDRIKLRFISGKPNFIWFDKKIKFFWDGFIALDNVETDEYNDMIEWLKDAITIAVFKTGIKKLKCEQEWYSSKHPNLVVRDTKNFNIIYFRYKEDAMAFKLRWE